MSNRIIPHVKTPVLILDFDGTLSEIQPHPSDARPYPGVVNLLEKINQTYPVIIVTGRLLEQLEKILPKPPLFAYGLHGTQSGFLGGAKSWGDISNDALESLKLLRKSIPQIDGLIVEDKHYGFALHYRNYLNSEQSERSVTKVLDLWLKNNIPNCLTLLKGKKVYDIRAAGYSKASAVKDIVRKFPQHTPVYIGDDTTDEQAFEELNTLSSESITIKVGPGLSQAKYRLESVADVVAYLEDLQLCNYRADEYSDDEAI
jgi:trehalose 6-phosphate phosphatase